MKEMYQLTATQVMKHFNSPIDGLTSTQAEERRRTSGWNELTAAKSKPLWKLFLEQFQDFLVIILIIAAIISGLLGDAESAVVILGRYHSECHSWNSANPTGRTFFKQFKKLIRTKSIRIS